MADAAIYQALDSYGLTSFSNLIKPTFMPQGAPELLPLYRNASIPMTLFVPSNDAVDSVISPNTPGVTYFTTTRAFVAYHVAPGKWNFDQPSSTHVVMKTGLSVYAPPLAEAVDLENNTAQSLVAVSAADATGSRKTTFVDQRASIIDSKQENPDYAFKIYVLDQALTIPPPYDDYATIDPDVGLFHGLMSDALAVNLSNIQGFTAFVPAGDPDWVQAAKDRYAYQPLLGAFFNNHVIPFHTIYSPRFLDGAYMSASQSPYHFENNTGTGAWTVTLNGVKVNIMTADVPLADGVVHFIDGPFWELYNTTSASTSSSAGTATPTAPIQETSLPESIAQSQSLSPGIIAAIVIPIVVILVLIGLGSYLYWRYRRTIGVRELARRRGGLDGSNASVAPAALRTSPFVSSVDVAASTSGGASANILGPPHLVSNEKRGGGRTEYAVANVTSDDVDESAPTTSVVPLMSEATAQQLLQVLAQQVHSSPRCPESSEDESEHPPKYGA